MLLNCLTVLFKPPQSCTERYQEHTRSFCKALQRMGIMSLLDKLLLTGYYITNGYIR